MIKFFYQFMILLFSPLFDKKFYKQSYQDVREAKIHPILHYLKFGWKEGRNPSRTFDTNYYLEHNPDVREKEANPLIHFILIGRNEGRNPHATNFMNEIDSLPNLRNSKGKKKAINVNTKETRSAKMTELQNNSINNPIFYLHVGQGKTGTSVIQNFLDVNRVILLSEHSLLYPNLISNELGEGRSHNHQKWFQSLSDEKNIFIKELGRVHKYIQQNSVSRILLSFEGWDLNTNFQQRIHKALIKNNFDQIRVIYYFRRVDHLVQSSWKQWGIHIYDNIKEYYQLPKFTEKNKKVFDYLSKWADLIGPQNVLLRPYERQQLNEGLIPNFLSIFNISYESTQWNPTEDHYWVKNPGFNRDILELVKLCRHLYPDENKKRLFHLFYNSLGQEFQKKPYEDYTFLSPEQKLLLLHENRDFEPLIARKFLGRERVFFEPWPNLDDPWEPYEGLTLEKFIPIVIKMIDQIYAENKQLKKMLSLIKK